jgi:ABC-type glycerol-3-phosphate transport system permease component
VFGRRHSHASTGRKPPGASVLITSEELKTLPVGVDDLFNATIVDWGMIMAAGVMITVPTVCLFAAVQRYLVRGWGSGGVKG